MAKWMLVQLDSGQVAGGEPLFSPRTTRELWSIVTPVPFGPPPPQLGPLEKSFNGYGLGFFVRDFRGHQIITHTGSLPGYVSRLTLVPDLDLGIVVLTNAEAGAAFETITCTVLDHYLGETAYDWLDAYTSLTAERDSVMAARERSAAMSRDTTSRPSLSIGKYAGVYEDPWYGDVVVEHVGWRPGDPVQPDSGARRRPRTLAIRHVSRPLAGPGAEGGRVHHVRSHACR